ncbi:MAG TPA: VWA domain-containing protein [Candidatus Xenobia bacterium]
MSETPAITLSLDVNEFLNDGADRIDLAFTVNAHGFSAGGAHEKVVVAVIDCSGSMGEQGGQKINAARQACLKLIDMLSPSMYFSVVGFSDGASSIVELCEANLSNKTRAKGLVQNLKARGTTEMSAGLWQALREFLKRPNADGTCIFLTDGANNPDDNPKLETVLQKCVEQRQAGKVFQVQCRGVGTGWKVDQLRRIADMTLGGPPQPVFDAAALEQDFASCLQSAMSTTLSDVRVNLWVPQNVQVVELKQITPSLVKLDGSETLGPDGQTRIYSTGSWENESREFYGALKLAPRPVGKKVAAGRIGLSYRYGGPEVSTDLQMITVQWTDNQSLSARIPSGVAKATGQVELAASIQEGIKAYEAGDLDVATERLGRAVKLAHDTGHEEMTTRLRGMVEIVNPEEGTVRVKKASKEVLMDLDAASTRTVRAKK